VSFSWLAEKSLVDSRIIDISHRYINARLLLCVAIINVAILTLINLLLENILKKNTRALDKSKKLDFLESKFAKTD